MKKIRSYTSIWSVEKVLYSINDFRLPFPISFIQMTWFVVSIFTVMILGNLPPNLITKIKHSKKKVESPPVKTIQRPITKVDKPINQRKAVKSIRKKTTTATTTTRKNGDKS